ncbi:MAG TPA: DUF1800 domain-containing protein [Chroococcales cyanobacterium]
MSASIKEEIWIAHLLRRAGFGASADEMTYYRSLGYRSAVEALLNPERVDNSELEAMLDKEMFDFTNRTDLRRWWIYRMAFSKRPLEEKMTLFWHGHFATSVAKVGNAYLMYDQNELFRRQGLGRFGDLLLAVSKDPAMIDWLDSKDNTKAKPNENYAREVMELFTLGIGNYSEQDVKEAARAFTGWAAPKGFYFNRKQHDAGSKTVLGLTGNLNGDDVCAHLAKLEPTAMRLSRKLVAFFCMDNPPDDMVAEVAEAYQRNDQQIKPMLRTIFLHDKFKSEEAYHCKIKSPAELVIGTIKALNVQKIDGDLPNVMARMGQNLFEPPSVKGWDGGLNWIATDTMMERFNFASRISTQKFDAIDGYVLPSKLAEKHGLKSHDQIVDYFVNVLVDNDIPANARKKLLAYLNTDMKGEALPRSATIKIDDKTTDAKMRGLLHLIMTMPSYQLA